MEWNLNEKKFPHKFELFLYFTELIAGVPRGAQNFGYVSMDIINNNNW